jgi:DNA-binding NtrC family response regulator
VYPKSIRSAPCIRLSMASRDRAFARSLGASRRAKGVGVHLWEGRDARAAEEPLLRAVDVESHGLRDAEWSLVERVRERSPMVEIVAISDDPAVESMVQALRIGVYTLLADPVSDDKLLRAITEAAAQASWGAADQGALGINGTRRAGHRTPRRI